MQSNRCCFLCVVEIRPGPTKRGTPDSNAFSGFSCANFDLTFGVGILHRHMICNKLFKRALSKTILWRRGVKAVSITIQPII